MTDTNHGHEWTVLKVQYYKNGRRMGDGDTLSVLRRTKMLLGDCEKWVEDIDFEPIRLAWVDTPEKSDPAGWSKAAQDLSNWIERKLALGPLRVVCFGSAGWDRELADLVATDGESASQWLMTQGNDGAGWPMYVRGQ